MPIFASTSTTTRVRLAACLVATSLLAGCAGMGPLLSPPEVALRSVSLGTMGFSKQTFLLGFEARNPNAFALPVNYVSYSVKLNEQAFARGETVADFEIAADGVSEFTISVELDLLHTAPQLLYTVRDGVSGALAYELSGKLGIDLPLVDRVAFRASGAVRLNADGPQGINRTP